MNSGYGKTISDMGCILWGCNGDIVGGYAIIRWFLHVLTTTNESWIWVCLKIAIIFPYRFYISHFKRTHDVLNRWRALFSNKPTW